MLYSVMQIWSSTAADENTQLNASSGANLCLTISPYSMHFCFMLHLKDVCLSFYSCRTCNQFSTVYGHGSRQSCLWCLKLSFGPHHCVIFVLCGTNYQLHIKYNTCSPRNQLLSLRWNTSWPHCVTMETTATILLRFPQLYTSPPAKNRHTNESLWLQCLIIWFGTINNTMTTTYSI